MPILSSSAVLSASFSTGDVPTAQDFENLILSFAIYDGTLPVISGSIIGTGSFGQLKVVNVGTNLTPYSNDKVDLGSTSVRWKNSYFSTASISLLSGSLIPHSSGTYQLGSNLKGFKETHTDTASIGIISSSLTPDADNEHSLGASGQEWKDLYVDGTAYIDAIGENVAITTASLEKISSSLLPDSALAHNLGSEELGWNNLYVSGTATIGTLAISSLDSGVSITGISSSTEIITISGSIRPFVSQSGRGKYDLGQSNQRWHNLYLTGSVIADSASIGVAKFDAISSSLLPDANGTYDLGSSTLKWGTIHATTISGSLVVTGSSILSVESASISYLSASSPIIVGASIIPDQTSSHDLGTNAVRWKEIFTTKIQTVSASLNQVTINGNVAGNLIPNTDDLYDLGSATNAWKNLYIDGTIIADNAIIPTASIGRNISNIIPTPTNTLNLGSSDLQWLDLYVTRSAYINNLVVSGTIGNVTASGNISASDLIATNVFASNITASGDISASGTIFANAINISGSDGLSLAGNISASSITASIVTADTGSFGQMNFPSTASIGYVSSSNIETTFITASYIMATGSGTGSFDYLETAEWLAHKGDTGTGIQFGSDTVDILSNTATIARFRTTAGTILGNNNYTTTILGSTLSFTGDSTFANSILIGGTGSLTTSTFVSASEFIGNISASNIVQPFTNITASVISGACLQLSSSGLFVQDLCGEAYINLHGYNSRIVFTPLSGGLEGLIYNGLSMTGSTLRVGEKSGLGSFMGAGAATEVFGTNVNLKSTGTINLEADNNQIAFWPGRENKIIDDETYEPYVRWNYESGSRFSPIVHTEGSASHVNVTTMTPTGSLLIKPMDGFVFLSGSKSSSGTHLSVYGDITASADTSTSPHRLAIISASGAITASGLVLPTGSILIKDTNALRGKEAGYFLSQPFAEIFGGGELGGGSQSMNPASPYMSHYTVARVHRGGELGDTGGDAPFKNLLTFGDHVWPTRISGSGVRINSGDFDINLHIMPIFGGTGVMRWQYAGTEAGDKCRWRWVLRDSSSGVGAGPENPRVNVTGDWVIQTGEAPSAGGLLADGGGQGGTVYISGSNLSVKSVSGIGGNITSSGQISASGNTNTLGNNVTLGDTCSDNIIINGAITASCDISASGTGSFGYISMGSDLDVVGNATLGTDCDNIITLNGELLANCDITASKGIVASGSISAYEGYQIGTTTIITSSYTTLVIGSTLLTGNGALDVSYAPIQLLGNITASSEGSSSGDISASGAILASEAIIMGDITASGNVSASDGYFDDIYLGGSASSLIFDYGGTYANTFYYDSNDFYFFSGSTQVWQLNTKDRINTIHGTMLVEEFSNDPSKGGHITASGNIMASGSLNAMHGGYKMGNTTVITASGATIKVGTGISPLRLNATEVTASRGFLISSSGGFYNYLHVIGDITASNISASGTIYAEDMILSDDLTVGDSFNVNGNVSASGNITGLNLIATGSEGNITASGDILNNGSISTTNITASGNISASGTSHAFGGSIIVDNNITADNLNLTADLTASGDISASGNIITSGDVSASGDIYGKNVYLLGSGNHKISFDNATTNDQFILGGDDFITVDGDNFINLFADTKVQVYSPILQFSSSNASGNITASGNISASGTVLASEAIIMGNITASGDISASGTVYANNFQSTGGDVSGIDFTDDVNITGNISASGHIYSSQSISSYQGYKFGLTTILTSSGTTTRIGFGAGPLRIFATETTASRGFLISASGGFNSYLHVIGDITASNISASGTIYADDLVLADDLTVGDSLNINGNVSSSGNITGLNIIATGSEGNITASGNILNDGSISTTNITASGNISASGNITSETGSFGRVEVTTDVSASGDIFANRLNLGVNGNITVQNTDGSYLNNGAFVGIAAGNLMAFGDADWNASIQGLSLNITPNMTASNISASSIFLTGALTASSNVSASNIIAGNITSSNMSASGYISASNFVGGNSIFGNITASNISASTIIATGSITSTNITASGNISASGNGYFADITASNIQLVSGSIGLDVRHGGYRLGGTKVITSSGTTLQVGNSLAPLQLLGNVTASGNISASGYVTASNIWAQALTVSESIDLSGDVTLGSSCTDTISVLGAISSSCDIETGGNITASGHISAKTDILVQTGSYLLGNTNYAGSGSFELSSSYFEPILHTIFFGDPSVDHFFNTKDYYAFNSGRVIIGTNQNQNLSSIIDVQGSASFSGDITASGTLSLGAFTDVSASLAALSSSLVGEGADNLGNHTATEDLNMSSNNIHNATNISASNDISASRFVRAHRYIANNYAVVDMQTGSNGPDSFHVGLGNSAINQTRIYGNITGSVGSGEYGGSNLWVQHITASNITSSGNISSSGTITAADLIIDYDALPTSDPSVKGQVYRNGSNQLFVSAG